jgi:hypothetical protein
VLGHIDWMMRTFVLLFALHLIPPALPAQARPAPFETLDLGITVLADVNHGSLQQWWSPGPALGLGLTMPFYLGTFELGLQYAHPSALSDDVPGFRSLFVYAGWGGERFLGAGFAAGGGARVGVMAMRFDGDSLPGYRASESELGLAARAAVRWVPAGTWYAETSVSYQSVLTHHHMEQVFLGAGIGRRFATPAWLRDFLD